MLGRQHLVSGVAAGLGCVLAARHFGAHLNPAEQAAVIATWAIGSLGPDLDCGTAMLSRWLSPSAWIAKTLRLFGVTWRPRPMLSRIVCAVSAQVYRYTRTRWDDQQCTGTHRRLAHTTVWAVDWGIALSVALAAAPATRGWWWLGLCVSAGHLVHLAGDWLTPMGVPLAWPLRRHGKRWWMFRAPRIVVPVLRRRGWRVRVEAWQVLPFEAGGRVELVSVAPALWAAVVFLAVLVGWSNVAAHQDSAPSMRALVGLVDPWIHLAAAAVAAAVWVSGWWGARRRWRRREAREAQRAAVSPRPRPTRERLAGVASR